jgi:3'-5' exonuclease
MVNGVAAPGLSLRPYFNRYTEDAIDLCDVLSSFSPQAKATLHELCRVMGLPGKPDGMSGGEVEKYYRDGRIREIAEYCESDVVNTYRVWLRYELFRGRLSGAAFHIGRHCDPGHARRDLPEQLQPFAAQRALSHDKTGGVAARPREACDEATADRIGNNRENNRNDARFLQ